MAESREESSAESKALRQALGRPAALGGRWYVIGGGTGAGARTFLTLTNVVEIFAPEGG